MGDLPVQGAVGVVPVLPVGCEAQVFEVELVGFGDVEDAEDGGDGVEFWGHGVAVRVCGGGVSGS